MTPRTKRIHLQNASDRWPAQPPPMGPARCESEAVQMHQHQHHHQQQKTKGLPYEVCPAIIIILAVITASPSEALLTAQTPSRNYFRQSITRMPARSCSRINLRVEGDGGRGRRICFHDVHKFFHCMFLSGFGCFGVQSFALILWKKRTFMGGGEINMEYGIQRVM